MNINVFDIYCVYEYVDVLSIIGKCTVLKNILNIVMCRNYDILQLFINAVPN